MVTINHVDGSGKPKRTHIRSLDKLLAWAESEAGGVPIIRLHFEGHHSIDLYFENTGKMADAVQLLDPDPEF